MITSTTSWVDRPQGWLATWQATRLALPFTWLTRVLLWLAFLPSGWVKLLGQPFTVLPPSDPVGYFFDALLRTGLYYQFIGAAQLLAGLLILIPRTAAVGAILYLCLITNIFVITVSLDFEGTPVITGLMLLAALYLLAWEYPRWRSLLEPARSA
ncbi:hypothetical protein GCM10017783_09220 [Deinococcus piscis]|uniref:DoxX family protein n=1 Tax=Deinococcus piscis TaxID=394230 RepID=A0ABQ3K1V0_9DEIO|nr:DoxX family membrane protein [Deinococcus piscis]GHF99362.1 hypothetical protein GCM10017783_09220 [Deinococcus piscis]